MGKKYTAKFGPAATKQFANSYAAERITAIDPPRWPEAYHAMQAAIQAAG